ncbi:hypothetical protein BGZ46_006328, partial [Entomortierella lignicola]
MDMNGEIKSSTQLNNKVSKQDTDGPTDLDQMLSLMNLSSKSQSPIKSIDQEPTTTEDPALERQAMLQEFSADGESDLPQDGVPSTLTEPITYFNSIPPVAEPSPHRRLDAPRLREIRKRLDSGHCTQKELDNLSNECLDECVELCSGIGNIPSSTTPTTLHAMFAHFGAIESARVLTHKSCGFINFESMDDAVVAKKVMHGQEIFGPGTGAVRIGFAK